MIPLLPSYPSANESWVGLLTSLVGIGDAASPRGQGTRELLGWTTVVDLARPLVTVAARELGYRYLAAEAAWVLSGDNRVSTIAPYSKRISSFSDDGVTYFGAYGPRFVDQVGHVVRALRDDPETRQAVMTFWRPNPPRTRDVPCTVALQWLVRDRRLHCVVTMRSSDAWLGWPYDVHTFAALTARVLVGLRFADRAAWSDVGLGALQLTAGSQHLYDRDRAGVECVLLAPTDLALDPAPLDVGEFTHPDQVAEHYWSLAYPMGRPSRRWLAELALR